MRRIRFTLNPDASPTIPDSSPEVRYGFVEESLVHEIPTPFGTARGATHPLDGIKVLPACWPSKIVCVGRNYAEHAKELGNEVPAEPLIFLKPPSSLIANGDPITYPAISQRVDYEGELGVVIGRRGKGIDRADAAQYIYGYTVVNDMTARDLQRKDVQFTRGKGFDTFCPTGPHVVTADEVDISQLRVRTLVDGVVKQEGVTRDMIFPVDVILEFVSQCMTLEPGDLIATGTPPGVSPVERGAVVTVVIDNPGTGFVLGTLQNRLV